jgi:hypothetical protein
MRLSIKQPTRAAICTSFIWLGATSFPFRICVVGRTAPVKTPADLFTRELIVGSQAKLAWRSW